MVKNNSSSVVTDWDPQGYAKNARFVADLGRSLIEWLNPSSGERILDLGCGDGVLTEELQQSGCDVVGADSSPRQVEAACQRGLKAVVCDGENLPFFSQFDAVFSNAALHWMRRPDAVLSGVARSLKPQGRFVGEFGAAGNVDHICQALSRQLERRGHQFAKYNPWYFPEADEYRDKLTAAGFEVVNLITFPRPTLLPGDLVGWLETFAQSFTAGWSPDERASLFTDVREDLRPHLCNSEGQWTADYVRLRFLAVKRPWQDGR